MPLIAIEASTALQKSSPGDRDYVYHEHAEPRADGQVLTTPSNRGPFRRAFAFGPSEEAESLSPIEYEHTKTASRRPSFSSKQAEDVAAAVRFRLELERLEIADNTTASYAQPSHSAAESHRIRSQHATSISGSSPAVARSRLARVRDSQSVMQNKKSRKPSPLHLHAGISQIPLEVQSAGLPPRQPLGAFSSVEADDSGPQEKSLKRSKTISVLKAEPHRVFGGGKRRVRRQSRGSEVPPLPPLTNYSLCNVDSPSKPRLQFRSFSDHAMKAPSSYMRPTTSKTASPGRTDVPNTASPGTEELYASDEELLDSAVSVYVPLIPPPVSPVEEHDGELKRSRSRFRWLQRRSELDELIELYMDDAQLDAIQLEKKLSRPRWIAKWPMRSFTDPLAVKHTAISSKL